MRFDVSVVNSAYNLKLTVLAADICIIAVANIVTWLICYNTLLAMSVINRTSLGSSKVVTFVF